MRLVIQLDLGQPRVPRRQVRVPGVVHLAGGLPGGLGQVGAGGDHAKSAGGLQQVELGVDGPVRDVDLEATFLQQARQAQGRVRPLVRQGLLVGLGQVLADHDLQALEMMFLQEFQQEVGRNDVGDRAQAGEAGEEPVEVLALGDELGLERFPFRKKAVLAHPESGPYGQIRQGAQGGGEAAREFRCLGGKAEMEPLFVLAHAEL